MSLHVGLAPAVHPGRVVVYGWIDGQLVEIAHLSVKEAKVFGRLIHKVLRLVQATAAAKGSR